MIIQIEPVENNGQHWVEVIIGGTAMQPPRGPYSDNDAAEAMAARLRKFARALTSGGGNRG